MFELNTKPKRDIRACRCDSCLKIYNDGPRTVFFNKEWPGETNYVDLNALCYWGLHPEQNRIDILRGLVSLIDPRANILEIGSYVGFIANAMVSAWRKVFCVDTWENKPYNNEDGALDGLIGFRIKTGGYTHEMKRFYQNTGERIFNQIIPIRDFSASAFQYLDKKFGLIYIDGAHDYKNTITDIALWSQKLEKGGILCGDDYFAPGVKKAVDEYFGNHIIIKNGQWIAQRDRNK